VQDTNSLVSYAGSLPADRCYTVAYITCAVNIDDKNQAWLHSQRHQKGTICHTRSRFGRKTRDYASADGARIEEWRRPGRLAGPPAWPAGGPAACHCRCHNACHTADVGRLGCTDSF
jgi:hypothetical protein